MEEINNPKDLMISFAPTGDPFVDAGSAALSYWLEKTQGKNLIQIIEEVAKIYVIRWKAKINSLFLNSPITHTSRKGQAKIDATMELYDKVLNPKSSGVKGECRICGEEGPLFDVGREQFCLAGSAAFVNFHHAHEGGLSLCRNCVIKLFFLPLIVVQMGGNLALLQVTNPKSNDFWIKKTVETNLFKIGIGSSDGILKYESNNPRNALFHLATELIMETEEEYDEQMQLYHFTNFGPSPDCDIYTLPAPIFRFLSKVIRYHRGAWFHFVRRYYHVSKSKWNQNSKTWQNQTGVTLEEDQYRNNQNDVFEMLLARKSILPLLRNYAKTCFFNSEKFESLVAVYYAEEVLQMESKQILLIKKIADTIIKLGQQTNSLKKYLVLIEGSGKAHQLRAALIKIIKDNFRAGEKEPLITLDEYVTFLFPDGRYWGEVRDLMLIYLYEKMHEANLPLEVIADQEIEDTEENTITTI